MKRLRQYLTLGVIVGPLPVTLLDGQTADAVPVMANFNWIISQINANALGGFNPTSSNTPVGYQALNAVTSGINNTAIGFQALLANTTGANNTAIGVATLGVNTTGSSNTGLGNQSLSLNTTGNSNTAMGYQTLFTNNANQNVGVGNSALLLNSTGTNNVAIGYLAGSVNTTGSNNTFIGENAQPTSAALSNATALGAGSVATGSNVVVLGNGSIATLLCQVTTITGISDERMKKDVAPLLLGLPFIDALCPVSYRYNNGDDTLRYGFTAQNVERALGIEAVGNERALVQRDPDKLRTYRLGYSELLAPIVKAIQELKEMVAELQKKVK